MKKYLLICIIVLNFFSINAFAAEQDLTVSVSGTEYANPGNTVKICIKAEMNKETALQGVQVDYEMSDNLKNVQDIKFSVTENTTGWETVGLSGKNLLGVGKPIEANSILNGEISFTVPQNAANGTEYVVHIKEAVGADKDKEISAYVKNNTYTVKVMNETGNFGGAGSNSSLGKSETKSIPISATDYSDKNELRFTDVKETDWFYEPVCFVYENKFMLGVSNTEFAPNMPVTRAMFVTVLYRMEGEPEIKNKNVFTDVNSGEYYEKAVAWAQENEIVKGVSDNEFAPNNNITREQMATILYRFAKFKKIDTESIIKNANTLSHNDIFKVSEYAKEAMNYCIAAGIITGDNNGNLNPQNNATRAEFATILMRTTNVSK